MGGVFLRHHPVLIDDTEGRLWLPADGVQLVALSGAVKIELSLAVHIAQRHRVGVAFIPQHSKDAGGGSVQNFLASLPAELLAVSSHLAKHVSNTPLQTKSAFALFLITA